MKTHAQRDERFVSEIAVLVICADSLLESLRRESCLPSTEQDAARIGELVRGDVPRGSVACRILRLTRMPMRFAPTSDEDWRRLGCRLLDERHPLARRPSDADLEQVARQMITNRNTICQRPSPGPDGLFDYSEPESCAP